MRRIFETETGGLTVMGDIARERLGRVRQLGWDRWDRKDWMRSETGLVITAGSRENDSMEPIH